VVCVEELFYSRIEVEGETASGGEETASGGEETASGEREYLTESKTISSRYVV